MQPDMFQKNVSLEMAQKRIAGAAQEARGGTTTTKQEQKHAPKTVEQ